MKIAKPRRLAREKELKEKKQKQKQEKFMKKLESTGQVKRISGEEAMLQRFEQRIKERKDEIVKNTTPQMEEFERKMRIDEQKKKPNLILPKEPAFIPEQYSVKFIEWKDNKALLMSGERLHFVEFLGVEELTEELIEDFEKEVKLSIHPNMPKIWDAPPVTFSPTGDPRTGFQAVIVPYVPLMKSKEAEGEQGEQQEGTNEPEETPETTETQKEGQTEAQETQETQTEKTEDIEEKE